MNKESLKSNIDTLRAFSLLLLTSIFSIFGYAIVNLNQINSQQFLIGSIVLSLLIAFFTILMIKYFKQIKILGALK